MIKLPSTIPHPSQELSLSSNPNVTRTTMESGRSRQRRRFTSKDTSASITWSMTDYEYQLFEAFITYDAQDGAAWFEAPMLTGGQIRPHTIRLVNGAYTADYLPHGGWRVSAIVDIQTTNIKPPLWYYLADQLGSNGLISVASKIAYAANKAYNATEL